jgi:CRISPR/Cas system-associated exonuclease Cas4 (RecB family)
VRNVSKQIFLNALSCPALGWVSRCERNFGAPLTPGERFRMEQGMEVGRRARSLYPGGRLTSLNMALALEETRKALLDETVPVIYEGAFLIDGFAARADVLERTGDGWHLVEVKSSVNDREEFIDDMAYTAMVTSKCGLNICRVSLLLVSRDYRLGMPDERLFVEIDHTDEVRQRVEELEPVWQKIEEITRAPERPVPRLIYDCRRCELFGECVGKDIENHIFNLPRLNEARFNELAALEITRIEDIPKGFSLTEYQARAADCVRRNETFISEGLRDELEAIKWPAYYLDFETVMTAIPLYPDIAPYTQIPTQYSIHRCREVGLIDGHFEYLADPARDCREELARNLIDDLGESGSIIAYSNFEKAIINSLARLFPDLTDRLLALTGRIVDLEAIIRRNYYHPAFCGSTSVKRTYPVLKSEMTGDVFEIIDIDSAPVLVPELSYKDLDIAEGDSASAAFAYMALGKDPDPETTKKNLLEYCKLDTLAMVRLHQRLAELVE